MARQTELHPIVHLSTTQGLPGSVSPPGLTEDQVFNNRWGKVVFSDYPPDNTWHALSHCEVGEEAFFPHHQLRRNG